MKEKLRRLKSNPMGLAVWVVLVCGVMIRCFGAAYRAQYTVSERLPWAIGAIVFVLVMHECLHALAAKLLCKGLVRIRAAKDPMGIWSLQTVFTSPENRVRRAIIYLAPFFVLSVLPIVYLACVQPVFFLFLVAMLNGVGAYYDLLDVALMLL